MACLNITTISREQCIGNSLSIINENFVKLENGVCANVTRIVDLEQESVTRLNQINDITNIVVPGSAKAWCVFKGSDISQPVQIYNEYNIQTVERNITTSGPTPGVFRILFKEELSTANYVVVGTSSITTNLPTFVQVALNDEPTAQGFFINVININGTPVNADRVSIVVF
jgi:hypothetical protein